MPIFIFSSSIKCIRTSQIWLDVRALQNKWSRHVILLAWLAQLAKVQSQLVMRLAYSTKIVPSPFRCRMTRRECARTGLNDISHPICHCRRDTLQEAILDSNVDGHWLINDANVYVGIFSSVILMIGIVSTNFQKAEILMIRYSIVNRAKISVFTVSSSLN